MPEANFPCQRDLRVENEYAAKELACCERFREQVQSECEDHPDPMDCPDVVLVKLSNGGYGLPIRDGENSTASSTISVSFCPFCGAPLPNNKKPVAWNPVLLPAGTPVIVREDCCISTPIGVHFHKIWIQAVISEVNEFMRNTCGDDGLVWLDFLSKETGLWLTKVPQKVEDVRPFSNVSSN